jgi:MFS family permease
MWFTRSQQPIVVGAWYASQGIGIGLGGLIGYGIGQIKSSIAAWRYEFILIGLACALWGIAMAFIIPDSPYTTTRFTREEKIVLMSRKRDDYHSIDKRQTKWCQVKETFLDHKTYLYFLLGTTANIPNGGTSNFGTLMTRGFGFNTLNTTLLQIPYGLCQTVIIILAVWINHKTAKYNVRTYLMAAVLLPVVAGFAMMAYGDNQATKLIGYCTSSSKVRADDEISPGLRMPHSPCRCPW